MIQPVDDDEKAELLRALVVERFGHPPKRLAAGGGEPDAPRAIARRRRILLGLDQPGSRR